MTNPLARNTDPQTSHDAPGSKEQRQTVRDAVLKIFEHYQHLTDEELVSVYIADRAVLGFPSSSPSGIRTRRSELVAQGLIELDGRIRITQSGRRALVWKLADQ